MTREHRYVRVACPECGALDYVTEEQAAQPILPCSTACEDRATARTHDVPEVPDVEDLRTCECENAKHSQACTATAAGVVRTVYGPFHLCTDCLALKHMPEAPADELPPERAPASVQDPMRERFPYRGAQ